MPKRLLHGGALSALVMVCLIVGGIRESQAQSSLPSPWIGQDIGSPSVAGRSSGTSSALTVTGSGLDIGGTADQFHFVYQQANGDMDVRVRIANYTFVDWTAKAGIMIREQTSANARFAYVFRYPGDGISLRSRTAAGAGASSPVTQISTDKWLRLVRSGNVFTAYRSADGSTWTTVDSVTMTMSSSVYVGVAVTSYDGAASATATFDNIQGLSSSSTTLPAPWANQDLGSPTVKGAASLSGGTFTVSGAGSDVWGTADQFQFVYQPMQGDIEVIARVASLQQTNAWSKAGVMIRESLNAGASNAFMFATASNGWRYQRRIATNGDSYQDVGPTSAVPGWVRLVREANLFSFYQSTDGNSWTLVGSDNITMGSTVYVGLAVTSHDATKTAAATFTNVSVAPYSAGTNRPPTVSISSPSAGATFTAPASITVSAAASDPDGSVTRVQFYNGSQLIGTDTTSPFSVAWSNVAAGTYTLKAVATDSDGVTATSPTVSVTVNASGNQAPTVAISSPANGATYSSAPAEMVITATASDSDGISRVEIYQGSTLLKSDTTAPYSVRWSKVPAGTYQLTAIARDKKGATRTSTPVTVTVNGANQPPTVSLTSPAGGASFTAPASIALQASASDSDGQVTRVEFYRGSTLIGSDSTSPYSVTWSGATAGSYALTAKAFDEDGASRSSTAVSVTVSAAANQLPNVSISSPSAGATYTAPASMTITATASDPDGSIAGVDFYVGSTLIGTDTSSPFTASWTNITAGTYSITARARDNGGASRTSGAVAITVNGATTIPTRVVFVPSSDNSTNVTSYAVAIYRSSDPITASPVATRDLGKPSVVSGEISVDISSLVDPLATGSYKAVVRAVGPGGTTASAASASFSK